jgi:hypothetical protein
MRSAAAFVLLIATIPGCWLFRLRLPFNPMSGATVAKEGDAYVVRIRNCFDPAKRFSVNGLAIQRLDGRKRIPHCDLSWSGNAPSIEEWRYGSLPPGYTLKSCLPLQAGQRYEVQIRAGAGGHAQFSVDRDGNVRMLADGCSQPKPPMLGSGLATDPAAGSRW